MTTALKRKLLFATNNAHKLAEVQAVLGPDFELTTPRDCGVTEDIPETCDTLEGNASQKAYYLYDRIGTDCFADDTGLEVAALGGAPGVHSARYATDGHDFAANNELLLRNLEESPTVGPDSARSSPCCSTERNTSSRELSKAGLSITKSVTRDSATIRFSSPTDFPKPLRR